MDIVERLRTRGVKHPQQIDDWRNEAADEIERLREHIAVHQELWNKTMIELAVYQAKEGKLGIDHERK